MLLWGPDSLLLRPVPQIPEKMDKQFNPLEKRIFYDSFVRGREHPSTHSTNSFLFISSSIRSQPGGCSYRTLLANPIHVGASFACDWRQQSGIVESWSNFPLFQPWALSPEPLTLCAMRFASLTKNISPIPFGLIRRHKARQSDTLDIGARSAYKYSGRVSP